MSPETLLAPDLVMPPARTWIRTPRDILADPRLVDVSGTARTLFAALWPGAVADHTQTIGGRPAPSTIGWLLAPNREPATVERLARVTGHEAGVLDAAILELRTAGAFALSDSGAWGLVGWGARSPEAARAAKYRDAAKAAPVQEGAAS